MMKIITRQSLVKGAIESFFKNYPLHTSPKAPFYNQERYDEVVALGDNPTADQVARAINPSWVECCCSECRESHEIIVQVGHEPDYESDTAWLCKECAYKAFDMIAKAECE